MSRLTPSTSLKLVQFLRLVDSGRAWFSTYVHNTRSAPKGDPIRASVTPGFIQHRQADAREGSDITLLNLLQFSSSLGDCSRFPYSRWRPGPLKSGNLGMTSCGVLVPATPLERKGAMSTLFATNADYELHLRSHGKSPQVDTCFIQISW